MEQVGRYKILGELGRGAMGVVYKAQDPAIGRVVAIKSIRLNDLTDEAERGRLRERLFREAQSAGILSHPGIVTIYDIAEEGGLAYIFMEFVNGPPLEKMLLTEQTPDKVTLLSIFRQTAVALDYAHSKGIVHRDVKPANIMIHEDGSAKVTDFGVAKIMSQQMTQTGTIMGTPSYMSPEQIQGLAITGRADQFSLAVIAYEVLTGEKPFAAEYLPTLLYKVVREEALPPQRLNTTLDPQVEVVFRKALAKNPDERYETCADFVTALSASCNINAGWTPLPRGTSHNMPTVGSREGLVSTIAETQSITPVIAGPAVPVSSTASGTWQPRSLPEPEPPSKLVRNVLLFAAAILILAGGFFAFRKSADKATPTPAASETPATPAENPPAPPTPDAAVAVPKPAAAVAAVPVESSFQLTSTPPGATAVFDDKPETSCTTPCDLKLLNGRHAVMLHLTGFRDTQKFIEVPSQSSLAVEMSPMTGTLSLTTNPPGLAVVIDDQEQPRKTPLSINLPAGEHRVQVVKGTEQQEFSIEITDGQISAKTVNWQ